MSLKTSTLTNSNNNNNNNNALTQINQNSKKLQTEDQDLTTKQKDLDKDLRQTLEEKSNEKVLEENKNQSFSKIISSISKDNFKDNKELVSLGEDLDKFNNSNSLEVKEKLLDLKETTNSLLNKEEEEGFKTLKDKANLLDLEENLAESSLVDNKEITLNLTKTKENDLKVSLVECVLDSESYKLLQKIPINNPFYRFHKQSNSFREMRKSKTSFNFLNSIRKFKSDTDLCQMKNITGLLNSTAEFEVNNFYFKNNIVVVTNPCNKTYNTNNTNTTTITRNQKLDLKFSRQQFNKLQNHHHHQNNHNASKQMNQPTSSESMIMIKPNDFNNSTVITNPFSIFHDDESHLTLTVDKRLRCASSASRRMVRKPTNTNSSSTSSAGSLNLTTGKAYSSQQHLTNYHYLYGVPIKKFERQDFPPVLESSVRTKKSKLPTSSSSTSVFKQISLRKMSKTASASSTNIHVPLTGPQLKRLKISYPNHTQPVNMSNHSNKNTYFSRLQAKTKQGLQKLKDKCKQFNTVGSQRSHLGRNNSSSSFKTMSKVESFRFISDRDNIRNYETRCMAAYHQDHKQKPGTLYKSYKSELDLSKNLNYLEAYLNQNFEQQQSAQSVGRAQGQKIRRAFHQINEGTYSKPHKAGQSNAANERETPKKLNYSKNNYENVQSINLSKSESLSSSDYASVFSANCNDLVLPADKENGKTDMGNSTNNLRYEHPKMSEFKTKPELIENHIVEDDEEVEDNELVFKQELLRLCQNKDNHYFEDDFNLTIPDEEDEEEDDLACQNIRILINNSEDFERSPEEDWYMQRTENDSLSEVAFYQSLNEQQLYEERQLNYDPFITPLTNDLYPFSSETEDEKQLISSSSSLQRSQRLSTSLKYDYQTNTEHLNAKSLQMQDYKTAAENAQLMQSLYKTYQTSSSSQTHNKNSTLSNSSSSTSSINQQHSSLTHKITNHNPLKTPTQATPTFNSSNQASLHQLPPRRTSTSSSDNFDSFISTRSTYQQKIPSKRSSFTHYQQRSSLNMTSPNPSNQPQMNALNYYGVSNSNDTYSIPFKLQSSSSSSNHSSKLSNSSSNSTTSSSHNNPLIIAPNHIGSYASTTGQQTAGSAVQQINLTKFFNNQNNSANSSSNTTTSSSTLISNILPTTPHPLLYNNQNPSHHHHSQEKRDKFILEYEC